MMVAMINQIVEPVTEIHYEDFLPKDRWLEMKPKQFTKNHKHGNHFEIR